MVSELLPIQSIDSVNVVDSRLIAQELGIQHESFVKTIKTYKERLEKRGVLRFEIGKPSKGSSGGRPETFYWLNERHCIFLVTLSRNTEQVVDLKDKIEESFYQTTGETSIKVKTPQTYLEALKALVASEEEKEILKLQNEQLEQENELLSEAVDELFNYSSIIRVAKFNNMLENKFNYHRLKAVSAKIGIEPKKVPCPRFEYKLLYHHDAWRIAYPDVSLPETITIRVA